ncbi:MAG: SUF system NifU family Fe-S cluster assembly protein [SAR202 cluster bacterium]|nr:SUF system NifU family Fe-S cluster assembly protein [SAR202 cluster bacterium]
MQDLGDLDSLYRELILDHHRSPRNTEPLISPDVEVDAVNPFCGDEVKVQLKTSGGTLNGISVTGRGCSISQSSASMMGELVKGRSVEDAMRARRAFQALMKGEALTEDQLADLGDLEALQGVKRYPVRIKCALLAWSALEDALKRVRA